MPEEAEGTAGFSREQQDYLRRQEARYGMPKIPEPLRNDFDDLLIDYSGGGIFSKLDAKITVIVRGGFEGRNPRFFNLDVEETAKPIARVRLKESEKIDDESFTENHLWKTIRSGKLEAVKFLNLYYTTPEAVARYKARTNSTPRQGDDLLESSGYVLLFDAATSVAEYITIHHYSGSTIKSGGRIYIKPEDIETLRAKRLERPVPRKHIVPPDGFSDPALITNSAGDYHYVHWAARNGKIQTKRVRDRIFVIEEEAKRILAARDAKKTSRA